MAVSIIIALSIFVALVMTACVMINKESSDSEKSEDNKY